MPYIFSGTIRGPSIRVFHQPDTVVVASSRWRAWETWRETDQWKDNEDQDPASLNNAENLIVLETLANATARGLSTRELIEATGLFDAPAVFSRLKQKSLWNEWLIGPGEESAAPADRATHYRLKWVKMGLIDSLFESQSGFSTTGATVICDLEDPHLVPHCILFWRASTHFLGGLGIIVLFAVSLGQGSAGKALMRTEMPGPPYESPRARMQHTAWRFAGMYVLLNIILAVILFFLGM
ncbi:MAG: TrkH family potassium uptake protein, partial [Planctomycetaceae bacterium]|nr:TrkH family potassium uptake protein [Planctomycetaceae bacterium]